MASKVPNFGTAVSLREYLNDQLGTEKTGYEPLMLIMLGTGVPNTKIYNAQLIWVGDQFYVCGNFGTNDGTFKMVPFNLYEWTIDYGDPYTYTVTLDGNGATTEGKTSIEATYDAAMTELILSELPQKTDYSFDGYFDALTDGNKYYNTDGSSAANWDKTSDTTLYAHWSPVESEPEPEQEPGEE